MEREMLKHLIFRNGWSNLHLTAILGGFSRINVGAPTVPPISKYICVTPNKHIISILPSSQNRVVAALHFYCFTFQNLCMEKKIYNLCMVLLLIQNLQPAESYKQNQLSVVKNFSNDT